MAQPISDPPAPLVAPFCVIGHQFIVPQQVDVVVEKYPCGNLVITDINHKIMLKVKPYDKTFHRQRVLLDANDNPIAMLREKNMSMHSGWNAFMGESKATSDLIFSTRTEHVIQRKTNVSVTLAKKISDNNKSCDLRIKGRWSKGNCTIYMGDSSTAIAKMHKPETLKYAKDKFTVTIQANMDYACVIALFAIVDAMENRVDVKQVSVDAAAGGVGEAIGAAFVSS